MRLFIAATIRLKGALLAACALASMGASMGVSSAASSAAGQAGSVVGRSFKDLVIFGDSLSDNGNLFARSYQNAPLAPYWQGRFADGPVWGDIAFGARGIPVKNYALAGMMTSIPYEYAEGEQQWGQLYLGFRELLTRDLTKIVSSYLSDHAHNRELIAANLHVLFVGSVNYLTAGAMGHFKDAYSRGDLKVLRRYVNSTVQDIEVNLRRLYRAGARQFVVYNLPDFYKAPNDDRDTTYLPGILGTFAAFHNKALAAKMADLSEVYPDATFSVFDSYSALNHTMERATEYGFSVTDSSCYLGGWVKRWGREKFKVCEDPSRYVFFDPYHPTTKAHCYISWHFYSHLANDGFIDEAPLNDQEMIEACKNAGQRGI